MPATLKYLSGSLMLENDKSFHVQVAGRIRTRLKNQHGYLAYKLTTLGRASDEDIPSFLLITEELGIFLIDIVEQRVVDSIELDGTILWRDESMRATTGRDLVLDIYTDEVQSRLKNDLALYDRRTKRSKIPVESIVVFCRNTPEEAEALVSADTTEVVAVVIDQLEAWLDTIADEKPDAGVLAPVGRALSLLEGTFIYENKRAAILEQPLVTINDYIQRSLQTTFQQDDAQRLASLQLPPGPQRIRGLAGTGKTIVLSIKAALTHKRFEEYKILYLFNTQSLYQHVQTLIAKYYTLEAKKAPDFEDHLHVFHAWGGRQRPGLYSTLCQKYGLVPLTLTDVRGIGDSLAHIYKDLLGKIRHVIQPEYDLVLIDEAQDFPKEVFELAYLLAKGEGTSKRIIWAYDEFQSLRDSQIKGPGELFGTDASGAQHLPDTILSGQYAGGIPKDFILPNCYRTPRPVLMIAHGVAMGLYSSKPAEMFYQRDEWAAIGYEVKTPRTLTIFPGDQVEIERPDENSKNMLETLLKENGKSARNLVQIRECETATDQLDFVSEKIADLISNQGVSPEEIIVINLRSGNNKAEMLEIQRRLMAAGVRSVVPGYVESSDVFKPKGFVTITTPFRAKGNEANIVFVLNAQSVASDFTLRMRNAFFVAVTRSRGWCYISGSGSGMGKLLDEADRLKADLPLFRFVCPDPEVVRSQKTFLTKSNRELDEISKLLELYDKSPEVRRLIRAREAGEDA